MGGGLNYDISQNNETRSHDPLKTQKDKIMIVWQKFSIDSLKYEIESLNYEKKLNYDIVELWQSK